jgi:hypothetical protein
VMNPTVKCEILLQKGMHRIFEKIFPVSPLWDFLWTVKSALLHKTVKPVIRGHLWDKENMVF